jgi:branched-chain amino acid transport system substrate-binding protein
MRRPATLALALAILLLCSSCSLIREHPSSLIVGAIYPLGESLGIGGVDEHRGVLLAADLVNQDGGVNGHPIQIVSVDAEGSDAAPGAVALVASKGAQIVLGSYSSLVSGPASAAAAARGMLFWETGAVGMLAPGSDLGGLTFRVPPTGEVLGRAAIRFIADELAPTWHRDPRTLRFAISYVNDAYGRSVERGGISALREAGLKDVANFGYDPRSVDMKALVHRIAQAKPDVLFVSAYLDDAIALRRQIVKQHVHLLANIGTSSSYCMPQFGETLGKDAVGVFASDKPSATSIDPSALPAATQALLARADADYKARWGEDMSPPALAGFSGAWALFTDVLPNASSNDPAAVADAARAVDLPRGSLPNGSGLRFGALGTPDAGDNVAASSVIWKWVSPGNAAVIWPPAFATAPMDPSTSDAW